MSNKLNTGGEELPPVEKLNSEGNAKPTNEESSVDFAFSVKENSKLKTSTKSTNGKPNISSEAIKPNTRKTLTKKEDSIKLKEETVRQEGDINLKKTASKQEKTTAKVGVSIQKDEIIKQEPLSNTKEDLTNLKENLEEKVTSKNIEPENSSSFTETPKPSANSRKVKTISTIDSGKGLKPAEDLNKNNPAEVIKNNENLGLNFPNSDYFIDPEYNAFYGDVRQNSNFEEEDFEEDFDVDTKRNDADTQSFDEVTFKAETPLSDNETIYAEDFGHKKEYYPAVGNLKNYSDNYQEFYPDDAEYSWQNTDPPLINENTIFYGEPKTKSTSWWLAFTVILGIYFITSLFTFNILLMPVRVEGASMEPTINNNTDTYNDVVYLQKTNAVSRGDIVVIDAKNYGEPEKSYIKRVVAVAGDTIQFVRCNTTEYWVPLSSSDKTGFENGVLYGEFMLKINGEVQYEDYITNNVDSLINEASKSYNGKVYKRNKQSAESLHAHEVDFQTLEEVAGVMILCTTAESRETFYNRYVIGGEEFVVPEGKVFVLGDNRTISNDSKYFGAVDLSDIVGKVRIHKTYDSGLIQAIIYSIQKGYLF